MLNTLYAESLLGAVTSPHHLATQAGQAVLAQGGNAIEAAIAVGSVLTVVYPHMNSIGGDAFFLLSDHNGKITAIDGAGPAGEQYNIEEYRQRGHEQIPKRGPLAANTVAGMVSVWDEALKVSKHQWQGKRPLSALLEAAHHYAKAGAPLTAGQLQSIRDHWGQLSQTQTFLDHFLIDGKIAEVGENFKQPSLAASFQTLSSEGLDSFYRGSLAQRIASGLAREGSLLTAKDFSDYRAKIVPHISVPFFKGTVVNMPPPTVGIASHIMLGILDRFDIRTLSPYSAEYIHLQAEATKISHQLRDRYLADPNFIHVPVEKLLSASFLDTLAARISLHHAAPFEEGPSPGDTVWFGVMDRQGRCVSAIQSVCWEYGSGLMAGDTGIVWQNRGHGFSMDVLKANVLIPKKRPSHTLSAPLYLENERPKMVFGTMGGESQPQTHAILAMRALKFGLPLAEVLDSPRCVLGRAWGDMSPTTLKLEQRFDQSVADQLTKMGHVVEWLPPYSVYAGHAGIIRVEENGTMQIAADPRSDGAALGV
jgi:oxamate amidohydrolase